MNEGIAEPAWNRPEARAAWLRMVRGSAISLVVGIGLVPFGVVWSEAVGEPVYGLILLSFAAVGLLMGIMTGRDALAARNALRHGHWVGCQVALYSKRSGRWPWLFVFDIPDGLPPSRLKEGWIAREWQAPQVVGTAWAAVVGGQVLIVAPDDFKFLLTVRPAKSRFQEMQWRSKYRQSVGPTLGHRNQK